MAKLTAVTITRGSCMKMFRLSLQFIKSFISELQTAKAIDNFKQDYDCNIPEALGAVDGTQVFIKAPEKERKNDYHCRKQRHSINTQAVVGANLLFLVVETGFPRRMHDSRVFRHSSLFRKADQNEIFKIPKDKDDINSTPSFTCLDIMDIHVTWMMKPNSFMSALNNVEKKLNNKLLSSRAIVERLFCICKARWHCFLKKLDKKVENVQDVIFTCFALHNFCQINGETYSDQDGIPEDLM